MAVKVICGHPDRPNFSKGRCKYCANIFYADKARLASKEKKDKRNVVPKVTDLTYTLDLIYKILSSELKKLPIHEKCEGHGKIPGCTYYSTEIHHKKGRRRFLLIMSSKFCYLCQSCHRYCTVNSHKAISLGLSERINTPTIFDFTKREEDLMEIYGINPP